MDDVGIWDALEFEALLSQYHRTIDRAARIIAKIDAILGKEDTHDE